MCRGNKKENLQQKTASIKAAAKRSVHPSVAEAERVSSAGLPSSRKMRSYWRESSGGL